MTTFREVLDPNTTLPKVGTLELVSETTPEAWFAHFDGIEIYDRLYLARNAVAVVIVPFYPSQRVGGYYEGKYRVPIKNPL
jgi:hypothetical protein